MTAKGSDETVTRDDFTPVQSFLRLPPNQWFNAFGSWLTSAPHMLRSFSALRIVLGTAILAYLLTSAKDRHYMWGSGSSWLEPATRLRDFPWFFNIFPKDNPVLFDILYIILILVTAAFIAGIFTRLSSVALLLLWVGLYTNSVVLANGGDVVMRITLFFILFANLGEHWSVDSWRRSRSPQDRRPSRRILPELVTSAAHNSALLILCWQLILIYVNSGIFKLRGDEWRDGTALYYAMNLEQFAPFPGLNELAWQITPFVYIGSFIGIWVQLAFPVMLIWRPTRYLGLALLMGMHLGIAFFFGLWPFSLAMIALDLLFIRDSSWERAARWTRAKIGK